MTELQRRVRAVLFAAGRPLTYLEVAARLDADDCFPVWQALGVTVICGEVETRDGQDPAFQEYALTPKGRTLFDRLEG